MRLTMKARIIDTIDGHHDKYPKQSSHKCGWVCTYSVFLFDYNQI
jgi:hypothetical protein